MPDVKSPPSTQHRQHRSPSVDSSDHKTQYNRVASSPSYRLHKASTADYSQRPSPSLIWNSPPSCVSDHKTEPTDLLMPLGRRRRTESPSRLHQIPELQPTTHQSEILTTQDPESTPHDQLRRCFSSTISYQSSSDVQCPVDSTQRRSCPVTLDHQEVHHDVLTETTLPVNIARPVDEVSQRETVASKSIGVTASLIDVGDDLITPSTRAYSNHSREMIALMVELAGATSQPNEWNEISEKLRLALEKYGSTALESLQRSLERRRKARRAFLGPSPRQKSLSFSRPILMSPTSVSTAVRKDSQRRRWRHGQTPDVDKTLSTILRQLNTSMKLQEQSLQSSVLRNNNDMTSATIDAASLSLRAFPQTQNSKPVLKQGMSIGSVVTNPLEESNLRERIAIITVLHQNVAAIQTLLAQREARVVQMTQRIHLLEQDWQSHDESYRQDPYRIQQHFTKFNKLTSETKRQRKLLDAIKPKVQSLVANIQAQKSLLRKAITGVRRGRPTFNQSALIAEVDDEKCDGPLQALKDNWKAVIHSDPELFRLRRSAVVSSILDYDLKEFIESNPFYTDILARHAQTPALLEALQFDGVSFLFSGIGTDLEKMDGAVEQPQEEKTTSQRLDSSSVMTILAHWIEENPYFYKLGLDECEFSIEAWELLSARMSRICRITDVGLTRCRISPLTLKVLLKCLRRNPISILDLGYNQLGAEGMKLLAKGLLQKLSHHKSVGGFQTDGVTDVDHSLSPSNDQQQQEVEGRISSVVTASVYAIPTELKSQQVDDSGDRDDSDRLTVSEGSELISDNVHTGSEVRNDPMDFLMGGQTGVKHSDSEALTTTALNGPWISRLDTIAGDDERRDSGTRPFGWRQRTIDMTGSASVLHLHPSATVIETVVNDYDVRQLVVTPGGTPPLGLNLTELLLPVNDLGDKGAIIIAQILRSNAVPHLASLDLRWNKIGVEGAAAIASALNYRSRGGSVPSLTEMSPSINTPIGVNVGHHDLVEMRPSLESLNLAGNAIDANGATSIISALGLSPDVVVVRRLNLSMNHINNDVFPSLESWIHAVATSSDVFRCIQVFDQTSINLEWNSLTDASAVQRLVQSLASPPFTHESTETFTDDSPSKYFNNNIDQPNGLPPSTTPTTAMGHLSDIPINLANNDIITDHYPASSILAMTKGRLTIVGS